MCTRAARPVSVTRLASSTGDVVIGRLPCRPLHKMPRISDRTYKVQLSTWRPVHCGQNHQVHILTGEQMPRTISSNSILETTFVSSYQGQRILNVFHYRWVTSTPTVGDGDDIVDAAIAVLHAAGTGATEAFKDAINEEMTLENVRYQWVFPARWSFVSSTLNVGAGTTIGSAMPSNVGATAQKISEYPGPGGRGSTHMTGAVMESYEGGIWTTGYRTKIGTFMATMDTSIDTGAVLAASSLQPVLMHKADPAISVRWLGAFVNNSPRVMRRRTLRVGE